MDIKQILEDKNKLRLDIVNLLDQFHMSHNGILIDDVSVKFTNYYSDTSFTESSVNIKISI